MTFNFRDLPLVTYCYRVLLARTFSRRCNLSINILKVTCGCLLGTPTPNAQRSPFAGAVSNASRFTSYYRPPDCALRRRRPPETANSQHLEISTQKLRALRVLRASSSSGPRTPSAENAEHRTTAHRKHLEVSS